MWFRTILVIIYFIFPILQCLYFPNIYGVLINLNVYESYMRFLILNTFIIFVSGIFILCIYGVCVFIYSFITGDLFDRQA